MLASLHNRYVLALFYVSSNSIYCIAVSSLLFSPSIYKSCFVICLQLPVPRLVYKLFEGGKVMKLVIFQLKLKFVVVVDLYPLVMKKKQITVTQQFFHRLPRHEI